MELKLNGQTVFYADGGVAFNGAKPTVVFVHGAGMDHTVWTLYTRYFARNGYNMMAFDLPGHGRSAGVPLTTIEAVADWLIACLGALGVPQATLAGHSMGSLAVLQAAAMAPTLVCNVALLGFSYPMAVGKPLLEAARRNEQAAIDMLMIWGHDHLAQIGGNAVPGMGIIMPIQRIVERAAPGVLFADLNACHTYAAGVASAQQLDCPVTLILGDRDRMTPLKAARAFIQHFRHAELVLLRDCGHGMLEERPEETYRALDQALSSRRVGTG
jgi:pimeloyl-ACP methyl ester carboxylesterase